MMDEEDGSGVRDVVAIDGPSGSGKSTVARELAQRLGYGYLDTGAMYRAVTWEFLDRDLTKLADDDHAELMLAKLVIDLPGDERVLVNGQDVTSHLRSREVESRVSIVSAIPAVRRKMRQLQRQVARRGPIVAEGRDIGSVVFPEARWKVYLDARPEERARRRSLDFEAQGRSVSESDVLDEIKVRDRLDSNREDAPLVRTPSAIYIDTTGKNPDAVVTELVELVRSEDSSKSAGEV